MATTMGWAMNRVRQIIKEPWYALVSSTYSTGSVTVTIGSATVTGSSTVWLTNVKAGETFRSADGRYYHIMSVDSNTQLTLTDNYVGATLAGQTYTITGGQTTNATIVDDLNDSQKEIVSLIEEYDENYFMTTGTISYAAATERYALPATNGTVKKVGMVIRTDLSEEKTLHPIPFQDRAKYLSSSGVTDTDNLNEYYYIYGSSIGIVPIPAGAVTNNITIHYVPEATDLTVNTSTTIIPDAYRGLWVLGAASKSTNDSTVHQAYQKALQNLIMTISGRQVQESRTVRYMDEEAY